MKKTKASVTYSKGTPQAHCGICEHFISGHISVKGTCSLVEGEIEPDMWCKLFEKKK